MSLSLLLKEERVAECLMSWGRLCQMWELETETFQKLKWLSTYFAV